MPQPGTVVDRLEGNPRGPALSLAQGPGGPEVTLSREELIGRGRAAARLLAAAGVAPGDRVVSLLPTGAGFLVTLFGTWYAGATIVPSTYRRPNEDRRPLARRLADIIRIARPRAIVGNEVTLSVVEELGKLPGNVAILQESTLLELRPTDREAPAPPLADDVALIQFTSGSTGLPRGAVIRHRQLVGNALAIGEMAAITAQDVVVSWLPLYHDMGFTGGLMCPLVWGVPVRLMATESFIRNPVSWLKCFETHGGTVSPAPPFALDLLAFRVQEQRLADVHLESWRYAWIGSEPIFTPTLDRFRERFAAHGLRPDMLKPCYGLAEATLAVTATPSAARDESLTIDRAALRESGRVEIAKAGAGDAQSVVCCGVPVAGTDVAIHGDDGAELAAEHEGRILVRGPGVMSGYYESDENPVRQDGWLDTGDLGFLSAGKLYVTGRLKDMIKRGGVSIQPHEIELAAGGAEGVRRGQAAAFSCPGRDKRREEIVVVVETRLRDAAQHAAIVDDVRRKVAHEAGVQIDHVEVVATGAVPRTSSGKVQRALTRKLFMDGRLPSPLNATNDPE